MKRVLVMNHSAVPRGVAGITRHADLFSAVESWNHLILAGDVNRFTGARETDQPHFLSVRLRQFDSNGIGRIFSWLQYAGKAIAASSKVGKVDVVYASSPHLLTPAAGYIVARMKRAGFIFEVRDLWPKVLVEMGVMSSRSTIFRALTKLEEWLYKRADHVIVMAPAVESDLLTRGVAREKLHYIPNGGSSADFTPSAPRESLRTTYGFHGFTAIYAGAHGPANGLDLLVSAMGEVKDWPINLVLVGGGVEKKKLQDLAQDLDLNNVTFMDPVPKTEIPDLLAAADVGIHSLADVELFRGGVSPNKLFDYMAAGLPIITNSPGLCHDLVNEAKCGAGVEPHGFAEGLKQAYEQYSTGTIQESGRRGAQWIDSHQSRQAMADRIRGVLDSTR